MRHLRYIASLFIVVFTVAGSVGEQAVPRLVEPEESGRGYLLEGAGPSLSSGYSPAIYIVERSQADYQRARKLKVDLYNYSLRIHLSAKANSNSYWGITQAGDLWEDSDFNDPGSRLFVAWWHHSKGWQHVRELGKTDQYMSYQVGMRGRDIDGHPHIMLLRDGKWIPAKAYIDKASDSVFSLLQSNEPPPSGSVLHEALDEVDGLNLTWLHYAAAWGKTDWIEEWLGEGKEFRNSSVGGISPMSLAAMYGHSGVVEILIKAGFEMTDADEAGFDACHFGITYGHYDVVKTLLENGYPPNKKQDYIYRPLSLAFDYKHDDIFRLIQEYDGKFPDFNRSGRNEILRRIAYEGHSTMIRFVLSQKTNPNVKSKEGFSPIDFAVLSGNPEAVQVLLEAGAKPHNEGEKATLLLATALGDVEIARLLLAAGGDPNVVTESGRTPLRDAIRQDSRELVQLLLESGASPNPGTASVIGLVELATIMGNGEIVADLFTAGAQCKMEPVVAELILDQAIAHDILEMAILAFDQCVDPGFVFYERFPLEWVAEYYDAEKIGQWWQENGNPLNAPIPEFAIPSELDAPPTPIAGSLPEYSEELHKIYGRIETKIQMIIDDQGVPRFPIFDKELPASIRLSLHEKIDGWRFAPLTRDGEAVMVKVSLPMVLDRPDAMEAAYELSQVSTPPQAIEQTQPYYPAALRRARVQGTVSLLFVIDQTGETSNVTIERSPHPLFSRACINAVEKWRFKPALLDDKPVPSRARIDIPFTIR